MDFVAKSKALRAVDSVLIGHTSGVQITGTVPETGVYSWSASADFLEQDGSETDDNIRRISAKDRQTILP